MWLWWYLRVLSGCWCDSLAMSVRWFSFICQTKGLGSQCLPSGGLCGSCLCEVVQGVMIPFHLLPSGGGCVGN